MEQERERWREQSAVVRFKGEGEASSSARSHVRTPPKQLRATMHEEAKTGTTAIGGKQVTLLLHCTMGMVQCSTNRATLSPKNSLIQYELEDAHVDKVVL